LLLHSISISMRIIIDALMMRRLFGGYCPAGRSSGWLLNSSALQLLVLGPVLSLGAEIITAPAVVLLIRGFVMLTMRKKINVAEDLRERHGILGPGTVTFTCSLIDMIIRMQCPPAVRTHPCECHLSGAQESFPA